MSDAHQPQRARSIGELQAKLYATFTAAAAPDEPYRPRPTDVIITPFGKCGTTWLQQTFHTLRTRGDEDFDDISRVVPWLETSPSLGIDVNAEQKAQPRGYKSHQPWDLVPQGARYIVSVRDPRDALLALTLERTSLTYMLANKDKFDDLLMRGLSERAAGLPPGGDSAKVREGKVGSHRAVLGADVLAEMEAIWQADITTRFGFPSYQALIDDLN